MNRIDRLTGMIIYLQGRRFTTVEELSDRYRISPRTVYRDLSALQEAGVPLGSEAGKGYFIVKGYHLPPVMFNREEATALLAAGRLMQKWEHTQLGTAYNAAINKIRAILPHTDKEYFETLEKHIINYPWGNANRPDPDLRFFDLLQKAIFGNELIEMVYYSPYNQDKTKRKVEPLGLLVMGNYWYLAGWCQKRKDYRTFRLDRMETCTLTGIQSGDDHTLKEYYELSLRQEKDLEEVVVRFSREVVRYIGDQKYMHGWAWEKEVENGVEMTFLCDHTEYFCRWLLIWGDGVTVIKPQKIQDKVRELVEELSAHHLSEKSSFR